MRDEVRSCWPVSAAATLRAATFKPLAVRPSLRGCAERSELRHFATVRNSSPQRARIAPSSASAKIAERAVAAIVPLQVRTRVGTDSVRGGRAR